MFASFHLLNMDLNYNDSNMHTLILESISCSQKCQTNDYFRNAIDRK